MNRGIRDVEQKLHFCINCFSCHRHSFRSPRVQRHIKCDVFKSTVDAETTTQTNKNYWLLFENNKKWNKTVKRELYECQIINETTTTTKKKNQQEETN